MKKSEIEDELISKIKIELDTLFYMPGEKIKGIIKIYPGIKIEIKNNILHLKLKLIQYEFWDYTNIQTDELKNINKTEVSINNIEYELKEEEKPNFKDNEDFENFSIVLIEKEDKYKSISIPFEFELDKNNDNLLPTFQYEKDKYILGIRHILTVECEEYNSVNYIGLFIGKQPNKNFCEPKKINYKINNVLEDIDILIMFNRLAFYFGEEIKYNIKTKLKYTFKLKDVDTRQIIYRKIQWIGYMKNSLLDKTTCLNTLKSLDSQHDRPFIHLNGQIHSGLLGLGCGAISGSILGGIICPYFLIGFLSGGILSSFLGAIGGLVSYPVYHDYSPGNKSLFEKCELKTLKEKNNINNNEKIKEEIQKFVYFKDNKIIGFIKFKNDITPPVNGYYFKCDYNLKIDIEVSKRILDYNKNVFKNKIDFYDGKEYIENMKKLLNINNLIQETS